MQNELIAAVAEEIKAVSRAHVHSTLKYRDNNTGVLVRIFSEVCDALNVTKEDLMGLSRKREIVEARQIVQYFIKEFHPSISLKSIGNMFNRDHSTVIHSLRTVADLQDANKEYYFRLLELRNRIVYCK
jgi:chromosomal replication initiation ATPase DnaA